MIFIKVQVDGKFFGRTPNRQWRSLREPQVQGEIPKV
jgi:hypothetical protein